MAQFPALIRTSRLNGRNGFLLIGENAIDLTGFAVSAAGDLDGDGYGDLIIGAPGAPKTFVLYGKSDRFSASIQLADIAADAGYAVTRADDTTEFGRSVSAIGDLNGDGFSDFMTGAITDNGARRGSGAAYVVFGSAERPTGDIDAAALDGTNGFKLFADGGTTAHFGMAVSTAGDFNGDGYDDLIVSAIGAGNRQSPNEGTSYILYGHGGAYAPTIDNSAFDGTSGVKIIGSRSQASSGWFVSGGGDINHDGFADVMITEPGTNTVYVAFGRATAFGDTIDLAEIDGSNGFAIRGFSRNYPSAAVVGDINGDGCADMIVGDNSTAAYIIFGSTAPFAPVVNLAELDGVTGFKIVGAKPGDILGVSVAAAGDVNGDGFDDVVIGAPVSFQSTRSPAGSAYVVFGSAEGFDPVVDLGTLDGSNGFRVLGVKFYDGFGNSVSSAGDVNDDGFDDLLIGARSYDEAGSGFFGTGEGAAVVVYGIAPDVAVARVGTAASQTLAGGERNDRLSGLAGDDALFGNAGKDILVGGGGADTLFGGLGADTLGGGTGRDVFRYRAAIDSTSNAFDRIIDFDGSEDRIVLPSQIDRIDRHVRSGSLSLNGFDTLLAQAVDENALSAHGALLFTPDSGRFSGQSFLVADLNGIAGYQAGEDLVALIGTGGSALAISVDTFI